MKQVSTNSTYTMRSVRFYVISMLPLISGWRELAQLSYEYVKQKPAMLELSGIPPAIGWGKNMLYLICIMPSADIHRRVTHTLALDLQLKTLLNF